MLFYRKYESDNIDKWIVLIHGIGGSSAIFAKQIKELKKSYNLLLIDLRGHGKTGVLPGEEKYTFEFLCKDVFKVLDHLKIKKAIFLGVSLGTLMIKKMMLMEPERVERAILAGAITTYNKRIKFWLKLGLKFKEVFPYMWLYSFFAWVLMPRKSHRYSRSTFIREAKKMNQNEFLKWFELAHQIEEIHTDLKNSGIKRPTLYVMGEDDYMFLETVKNDITEDRNNKLVVLKKSGHVCNVDNYIGFNKLVLTYLGENQKKQRECRNFI